jgi:hypothetical protein
VEDTDEEPKSMVQDRRGGREEEESADCEGKDGTAGLNKGRRRHIFQSIVDAAEGI